jgi:polysaccharide deacetylase family protein (PEP-CTERM system associated)
MTTEHHFTVDVEEYFHSSALEELIPASEWDGLARRSPLIVRLLLDRMDEHGVRGTFFVLGWLAGHEPELVKEIARRGHEVASHGWDHKRVTQQSPEHFLDSVRRSKDLLEDLVGKAVLGFRAPSFSIVPGKEWALDTLLEAGYRYDSSLFPIKQHPAYGYPDGERDPYWIERPAGRIAEIPPVTLKVVGTTLPAAGGAYFRLLPYGLVRGALRSAQRREAPGTFYIHPWELDLRRPTDREFPKLVKLRLFGGIHRVWPRLDRLFTEFRFRPMAETLASMDSEALVG